MVYKTTNLINGKYYIGCHVANDLNDGYLGSGKLLKRAVEKYGKESFKQTPLAICCDKKVMLAVEKEYVNKKMVGDTMSYNLKLGGEGGSNGTFRGHKHSEETKAIMSAKTLGRKCSIEARAKMSKAARARPGWTKEARLEMSRTRKGRRHSEETKRKISEANNGHKISVETRKKISEARKGKKASKETRAKMSAAKKGKKKSKEACLKQSATITGHVVSEETRKKIGEANKNRCYIYSDKESRCRRVKEEELEWFLSQGWLEGTKRFC